MFRQSRKGYNRKIPRKYSPKFVTNLWQTLKRPVPVANIEFITPTKYYKVIKGVHYSNVFNNIMKRR